MVLGLSGIRVDTRVIMKYVAMHRWKLNIGELLMDIAMYI